MNARQKAKKLKKELDYIKSQPLRETYRVIDIPTEHLRGYRIIPMDDIERYGREMIENEVRLQLSRDLLQIIKERIVINETRDLDRFGSIKYTTDIWVGFGRRSDSE